MLTDVVFILIGMGGLFIGGEALIRSSSRLATGLGIPAIVVGLTVVALGTSTPELVVSLSAAAGGSTELALGSIVGSNIANIGLILGLAGLIRPLRVHASLIRREIPLMVAISILVFLVALDGSISRIEGLILFGGYLVFTWFLYRGAAKGARENREVQDEVAALEGQPARIRRAREVALVLISIAILIAGAQFTVTGASSVARALGISELVIGLTLVAVGTSLPEVATSIIATLRGHEDLATSNAVGSNIANLLVILGVTAMILPVPVADRVLRVELPVMLAFAIVIMLLSFRQQLPRWVGGLLLAAYLTFVILTFAG
ncbi:MAG TPA: calcium/sodium antiporter [Candidatus Limnocylindrales bacterium]|nr:calcium/sodium antiporter [Candidatus Limnocylindrales bacterium]